METLDLAQYQITERRIAQLTLVFGAIASASACLLVSVRVGAGLGIGAILAWLNFRGLEGALGVLVRGSVCRADAVKVRPKTGAFFRLVGRYGFIRAGGYVRFFGF